MAAYAALTSLTHLIEQIQRHPDPPVPLDPEQAESLLEKISFLQRFLEGVHSRGATTEEVRCLESRIADVAHAAEDVIESHGVRKIILRASTSADLWQGLEGVIRDMEIIQEEVKRSNRNKPGVEDDDDRVPRRSSSLLVPPLGSSLIDKSDQVIVGFDDVSIEIMDRLTGNQSRRDTVPIVGMGGAGKTTLARSVYERRLIVEHFHTRLWVTISQRWSARGVLTEIILCQRNGGESREELNEKSEEDLGIQLYQSLLGRRYLIVMDDMWSIEAWDKLKFFLPDNNNGSRIMITTRLSKLASDLTGSPMVNVGLLDEDTSWDLLCKKVFVEEGSCPLELEEIGRKIARKCRGLPLSIVTIGGLLAKSGMSREHWEYVAENLSSLVNSEGGDRCLRILSLSYIHLPVHLKPCFLYMGLFPEDARISASYLIRLWVAEGFLKPINGKALEVVGEDYLKDLVERNLVSVGKRERWYNREIKYCFVHDLLRDLCVREADKEKILPVVRIDDQQGNKNDDTRRRIVIHRGALNSEDSPHHGMPYSSPFLRTCIIDSDNKANCRLSLSPDQHHLMRILAGIDRYTYYDVDDIVPLVNSRFLSVRHVPLRDISLLLSMHWNLQTLMVEYSGYGSASLDIWKMPQLRHIKFKFAKVRLTHPPPPPSSSSAERLLVLENLQTLSVLLNFECSEEVVKRIPNIKKLSLVYSNNNVVGRTTEFYNLNNLACLHCLESLTMRLYKTERLDGLALPCSLKKLSLDGLELDNETMGTVIGGSLPLLQVLELRQVSFTGDKWNPVEGHFTILRSLSLDLCYGLKQLNADSTHFPLLEHLSVIWTSSLEEFPSGIGDIQTLRSIELTKVSGSVVLSAKRMQEEQAEEFGNDGFEIQVHIGEDQAELKSLASNNFKIYG